MGIVHYKNNILIHGLYFASSVLWYHKTRLRYFSVKSKLTVLEYEESVPAQASKDMP